MGFWFFLSAVIVSNMVFKAYKLRFIERNNSPDSRKLRELEREITTLKEALAHRDQRLSQLEEAVFFGEFELKRQFIDLEKQRATKD